MPGSLSKTPMRMDTCGPSGQVPPKRLEPQTEQKALTALALAKDTNEFRTFEKSKLLTANTRLRQTKRARVLPTAGAVAMAGADERGIASATRWSAPPSEGPSLAAGCYRQEADIAGIGLKPWGCAIGAHWGDWMPHRP